LMATVLLHWLHPFNPRVGCSDHGGKKDASFHLLPSEKRWRQVNSTSEDIK
jgi:hypothetical protein